MEQNPTSFGAADRKTIEKNRRNYMKDLYSELHSLIPHDNSSKGVKSLTDQLDEAAKYIKKLRIKLEKLKHKRETLEGVNLPNNIPRVEEAILESACVSPQVDIHVSGSSIEIHLISGLNVSSFMFIEIVRMLQEESFEIQNANCAVSNNTCFQTIHSQVGDCVSSCGSGTISERIKKFVNGGR
ncbi:Transcription factor bHLH36 like [Heracleum sosnowskyi]|uniref:Transcription factor bHLH36 like n=1 Tax=Heracleum sosnowskyi TaxID=360622 RepID=A0AAD8HM61_9APIA|nr:Transcription factor bHLH36 like [Heracleum sosnowskyi]